MSGFLKGVGTVVLTAVLAALPAGVGARLLMRLVAVTESGSYEPITLGGTTGIVTAFAVFALPAVAVMLRFRRLRYRIGIGYGLLFTVFPAGGFMIPGEEALASSHSAAVFALNRALFVTWFVGYGVLLAWVVDRLQGLRRERAGSWPARFAVATGVLWVAYTAEAALSSAWLSHGLMHALIAVVAAGYAVAALGCVRLGRPLAASLGAVAIGQLIEAVGGTIEQPAGAVHTLGGLLSMAALLCVIAFAVALVFTVRPLWVSVPAALLPLSLPLIGQPPAVPLAFVSGLAWVALASGRPQPVGRTEPVESAPAMAAVTFNESS
jgi:hypothetical protein